MDLSVTSSISDVLCVVEKICTYIAGHAAAYTPQIDTVYVKCSKKPTRSNVNQEIHRCIKCERRIPKRISVIIIKLQQKS